MKSLIVALFLLSACSARRPSAIGPSGDTAGDIPDPSTDNGATDDDAGSDATWPVGGVVWGLLPGTTVRLANGNDAMDVGNATFLLPAIKTGQAYSVIVAAQPLGQQCDVTNGQGTIGATRITNIDVHCTAGSLSIGGTVAGLQDKTAVTLKQGGVALGVTANGAFTLPQGFVPGSTYAVGVWIDPADAHCSVTNGNGTISNTNITNISVTCAAAPRPDHTFVTGQEAAVEIGQVNMNTFSNTQLTTMATLNNAPNFSRYSFKGAGIQGGPLFVPDFWNHRVLVFNGAPVSNFTSADSTMAPIYIMAIHADANNFVTTNQSSYNSVYSYTGYPLPDPNSRVTTFNIDGSCSVSGSSSPSDVAVAGGKMFVADPGHNRILVWSTVPSNPRTRVNPDVVVGQPNMTTCDAHTTSTGLSAPSNFYVGRDHFVIADRGNHRVLIWNHTFNDLAPGQAPDVVLGQTDFISGGLPPLSATSMDPSTVDSDGTLLVVNDMAHNRVLIWDHIPTTNNQIPDVVLGQPDFTSASCNQSELLGTNPRADTLCANTGARLIGPLIVVNDSDNLRVMLFRSR